MWQSVTAEALAARGPQPNPGPVLGVLASGAGSNLDAIAHAIARGELRARIGVVIVNVASAGAIEVAARHGLPVRVIVHGEYPSREAFDQAVVDAMRAHEVAWVIMAGWMRLASAPLLDAFAGRLLNLHPSLLPAFKGRDAIAQARAAGVKLTGCTVHHVIAALDSGPIVAQAAVPVLEDDTVATLHARVQVAEHALYPRAIAWAILDHGALT